MGSREVGASSLQIASRPTSPPAKYRVAPPIKLLERILVRTR